VRQFHSLHLGVKALSLSNQKPQFLAMEVYSKKRAEGTQNCQEHSWYYMGDVPQELWCVPSLSPCSRPKDMLFKSDDVEPLCGCGVIFVGRCSIGQYLG